jgi:hypothetical protein
VFFIKRTYGAVAKELADGLSDGTILMTEDVRKEVARIRAIDVNDPKVDIASDRGPCRYNVGEAQAIREAKHEKISEAINKGR